MDKKSLSSNSAIKRILTDVKHIMNNDNKYSLNLLLYVEVNILLYIY